jgi:hypothetical protein
MAKKRNEINTNIAIFMREKCESECKKDGTIYSETIPITLANPIPFRTYLSCVLSLGLGVSL